MTGPQAGWLPGGRLHLSHGPIDLVIGAEGPARDAALARAEAAFATLLDDLVAVLPALRQPVARRMRDSRALPGIAGCMVRATEAHAPAFVTPMAAVAGAVADGVLAAMEEPGLTRAWVNNGGDIAVLLSPGTEITAAGGPKLADRITVRHGDPVRGIATSGWRGRSHSLGIADAVTVLARSAAEADVAATLIANAVDLADHPAVTRLPARELAPDSDLRERLVTVDVGPLGPADITDALDAGATAARQMRAAGLIAAAALWLGGETRTIGQTHLERTPTHA